MKIQPYLTFDGRCEEALGFYREALGAEVDVLMRYSEAPPGPDGCGPRPGIEQKIMHSQFHIGGNTLLASDGHCNGNPVFQGISLTLNVDTTSEAEKLFAALSAEGAVQMPLDKTFFSPAFGMLTDKFGVACIIVTEPA
jgi:PhnB protein